MVLRWQEEGDGVERRVNADGNKHVDINLPVFESVLRELEVEFIGERATIRLEAALDFRAFFLREEFSTIDVSFQLNVGREGEATHVRG